MKKIIYTFFFSIFMLGYNNFAQTPSIVWQKTYGGIGASQNEYPQAFQRTSDNGYIIVGETFSNGTSGDVTFSHGYVDVWVVKIDSIGNLLWQKTYGGTGTDIGNYIEQTKDGGYIVSGQSTSNDDQLTSNYGNYDCWVIKIDSTGTIQWQKSYGGSGYDAGSARQTPDGGYILSCVSASNNGDVSGNHGGYDTWIAKLDSLGTIEWKKTYGGTAFDGAEAWPLQSGYIAFGTTASNDGDVSGNHGQQDYWVFKLDTAGIIEWQKTYGGSSNESGASLQQLDNAYILSGGSYSNNGDVTGNHGGQDEWIVKIDSAGTIIWQKAFGGTSDDYSRTLRITEDKGFVITGQSKSNDGTFISNYGMQDVSVIRIDSAGTLLWQKCLGGDDPDMGTDAMEVSDSTYIVLAQTSSSGFDLPLNHDAADNDEFDFWVVMLKVNSTGIWNIADENSLSIYPNPSHDLVRIEMENSPAGSAYRITDLTGRMVGSGYLMGKNNVIDIANLENGTYIFHLGNLNRKLIKIDR